MSPEEIIKELRDSIHRQQEYLDQYKNLLDRQHKRLNRLWWVMVIIFALQILTGLF